MALIPAEYVNMRVRYQRTADSRFFTGWLQGLTASGVCVRSATEVAVRPGDTFLFQVFGPQQDLLFMGRLVSFEQQDTQSGAGSMFVGSSASRVDCVATQGYEFEACSATTVVESSPEARQRVRNVAASMVIEGREIEVSVLDISRTGLEFVSQKNWAKGEVLALKLYTYLGVINCACDVRYCRPDPGLPSYYRTGVRIQITSRIDAARWQNVLSHAA